MPRDLRHAYRLERPVPYMQGDLGYGDAARADLVQNFRGEMEPRGRSRDCPAFSGENRLVTFAVGVRHLALALYVGRQRGPPHAIDGGIDLAFGFELQLDR